MIISTTLPEKHHIQGQITTQHAQLLWRVPENYFMNACINGFLKCSVARAPENNESHWKVWVFEAECEKLIAKTRELCHQDEPSRTPDLIDETDFVDISGLSLGNVRMLTRENKIPAVKISGILWFNRDSAVEIQKACSHLTARYQKIFYSMREASEFFNKPTSTLWHLVKKRGVKSIQKTVYRESGRLMKKTFVSVNELEIALAELHCKDASELPAIADPERGICQHSVGPGRYCGKSISSKSRLGLCADHEEKANQILRRVTHRRMGNCNISAA